jgi:gliding motility-associated-like protein
MRSVTFTNPTKCGFCNGIVTLHGLHPGETDTITYNFNGTAQPQLSFAIGADSTAVIYDLCEGAYDNFVARTGGVCVSNVLGPITLKAPPIIPDFSFTVGENCKGDTLYCTNSSWPASDLTYIWSFGDGDSSTAVNPTHIYYSPGTYNIVLNITNTKCIADTTESVTLTNLINAGFTSDPAAYVCQKSPVVFTNTSTGTSLNYTWIFGDEITDHTRDVTHTYNNTGVYKVMLAVSNYVPCYDTVKETLAVDSISAISITATDTTICEGTSITFDGIFSDLGNTGMIWSFGDGDSIINVNPVLHVFDGEGTHTVTVRALYRACPDTSASATFTIFGHPSVYLGSDTSICPGSEAITIGNRESIAGANWLWSTGQTTEQINVVEPGTYYAIATVNGCASADTIEVRNDCYMNIPNVFTPNGDGLNDYFFPRQLLTAGLSTFSMQIFNRWGQLIFTSTSLDGRGWDGRLNDVPQPEGVYVFIIDATFKDGQREHHQGNVTLLR